MADSQSNLATRALQHLPEPVRAQLLGPDGDGHGGLVAEVLDDVLRNVGREARAPFKQPERWKALLRALVRALGLALQRWQPGEADPVELERLRSWVQERSVSQQLLLLLFPREDSRWDVVRLLEEMEASELDAERLGQADAEAWLRLLVAGFYHGVAAEPSLHELIALPLLRQLAERMGAQLVPPGEGEGVTAQLEYVRQLAHRLYRGEDLQEALLGEIQKMLAASGSRSHVQQQAMYQTAEDALGQVRRAEPAEARPDLLASIQGQLEDLRRKLDTRPAGPGEAELAEMEALYRKTVRDMFERLTFRGITQTGRPVSLLLEEVYVELKVVAEVPEAVDDFSAAERRLLHEAERQGRLEVEQDRELDSLRYRRWREEARREQTRIQHRSLDATGVELDKPAMVILGDPGSGKTTLLHYLALRAIRSEQAEAGHPPGTKGLAGGARKGRLPIFVPLAAYDEYLRRTDGAATLEQFLAIYYVRWRGLRGLEPLFHRALEEGRALVLFDGLDEVLELTTRRFVAQQVSGLIRQWEGRGNRFVITSRFIGYREVQLPGEMPHYMVLDFRPEEIKQFARRWCEAFEIWAVGGRRSEVALQRARQEEQALLADVNSKPSVAHLASNPLLLTMLALLRRQVGQLPARRIELYERYVRTLLDHWEVSRSEGARQRAPERLEPNVAQQHLMDLALWLQQHRPSGTARQRDMVRALAERALRREEKEPERATAREWEEAERKATRCIHEVRDIAGLIGERGHDAYGFLHLTFQEYFVGRALARESPEKRWELLQPNLYDPRWHEPLLLCAGQLGVVELREEVVEDLLGRILSARSEHEEVLHRNLFLATAVIADDVTRSRKTLSELMARLGPLRTAPVPSVRQQALAGMIQLMRLGHGPAREKFLIWLDEQTHALETLQALAKAPHDATPVELRGKLLVRLGDENSYVRRAAVEALGAVASSDGAVRDALLSRLGDEDSYVRIATVEALGAMAGSDGAMRDTLLFRLGDGDSDVRIVAVEALRAVAGVAAHAC